MFAKASIRCSCRCSCIDLGGWRDGVLGEGVWGEGGWDLQQALWGAHVLPKCTLRILPGKCGKEERGGRGMAVAGEEEKGRCCFRHCHIRRVAVKGAMQGGGSQSGLLHIRCAHQLLTRICNLTAAHTSLLLSRMPASAHSPW